MAIPAWLKVIPSSGNGTNNVALNGNVNTGRDAKNIDLSVQNDNVENCTIKVIQAGANEFVTIQATASPNKTGGNITISGKSNSAKLTFAWKQNPTPGFDAPIPANYTAAGLSTANGEAIENDPGSSAEYDYSIVLNIPENTTTDSRKAVLIVTTESGETAQCEITQAAGDAYLWVGEAGQTEISVTLPADGSSVEIAIISNTNWEIV